MFLFNFQVSINTQYWFQCKVWTWPLCVLSDLSTQSLGFVSSNNAAVLVEKQHTLFISVVSIVFNSLALPTVWFWGVLTLQAKLRLRPHQPLQLQPRSLEASRTTAPPGLSTTGSRLLTTAQPTLRPWVERHKPLRYTPVKNLLVILN